MRRLDKPLRKEYPPLKLYLDDIQKIEELLAGESVSFSIETDDYEFANHDDLAQKYKKEKLNTLTLRSNNPYLDVELRKRWAYLYAASSNAVASGLFFKIDKILSSRTFPRWCFGLELYWILIVVLGLLPLLSLVTGLPRLSANLHFGILAVILLWWSWVSYIRLTRYSVIIVAHKTDQPGFFERNKDNLASHVIIAVITVIATLMAQWLYKAWTGQ